VLLSHAFTLGNPEVYDRAIEEAPISKAIGGCAYETRAEAQEVLDAEPAGFLPPEWFEGRQLPGAVYEMLLPGSFTGCTQDTAGYRALTVEAPILRKVIR
jgi:hypothetical protein